MRPLSFVRFFGVVVMLAGCENSGTTTDPVVIGSGASGGAPAATQSTGGAKTAGSTGKTAGGSPTTGAPNGTGGALTTGGAKGTTTGPQAAAGGLGGSGGTRSQTSGGSKSTPPAGGSSSAGGPSTPSTTCDDKATATGTIYTEVSGNDNVEIPVTGKEKSYWALSNWWGVPNDQTVDYNGLSWTIHDSKNTVPTAQKPNDPVGFPTMYIGKYIGRETKGSNLPKLVSELTTIPTKFSTNSLEKNTANFNAAYDVWFTKDKSGVPDKVYSPQAGGAYLMVWLFDPSNRQPRGGQMNASGGSPNVPGHTVAGMPGAWDVWIDKTDPLCISYVATSPMNSIEFDLNKFIKDSVTNGYGIKSDMYLSIVFAGFEVWGGGNDLQVKDFCVQVN